MRICVIDGMGGKIGAQIIAQLRGFSKAAEVIALATNAVAAHTMMKSGANSCASGENAIAFTVSRLSEADVILGPLAVVIPNSMMGELTPRMAEAVATSPAHKMLLPLTYPQVTLIGVEQIPLPHLMETAIETLRGMMEGGGGVDVRSPHLR